MHVLRSHPPIVLERGGTGHNGRIEPPYPRTLVPLFPEFLNRRRVGFTYPLRAMEELGIDRPTLLFVVNAVALQPDEGGRLVDLFNPYPAHFEQWLAPAAAARAAGLVDEVAGRWHITAAGRALATRIRAAADAYLATLEPIPPSELRRLAALIQRAYDGVAASGVPHDHMTRVVRFAGDGSVPMVALENAIYGIWQARDDCHMSSWREVGCEGPDFDVLTRLWRREAATEAELAGRLPQQRAEDIRAALARLRADGLVDGPTLAVTEQGASLRQRIEEETDLRFFAPWPDDVGAEAAWIEAALRRVNAALAPAS